MKYIELMKRIAVASIGIPLIVIMIWVGHIYFLILVDVILLFSLYEFYKMSSLMGFFPNHVFGSISILFISWALYFQNVRILGIVIFLIVFFTLMLELFRGKPKSLVNSAITLLGVFYISLFSSFLLIREYPLTIDLSYHTGAWLVLFIFVTIWICDTAAYFLGYHFGKRPLFRRVSPKKTWEGAIGGLFMGIGAALGFRALFLPFLSVKDALVVGCIVGIIGQMGDLVESLFKRNAGVKDTSNILPGHGGILDRFDSPLMVGPFVYLYLIISRIGV